MQGNEILRLNPVKGWGGGGKAVERATGVDWRENAKEEKGGRGRESLTIELLDYRKRGRKKKKNFISFDAMNRGRIVRKDEE